MNGAAQSVHNDLETASDLARTGMRVQHSYEAAWDEASALALVSIARSLESIVAGLAADGKDDPASGDGAGAR